MTATTRNLERNLWLIDGHSVAFNALFIVPVLLPFFQDSIGLDYRDLMLCEAAFSASCILCDVPSSWLSDVWKRHHAMALGTFLLMTGMGLFLVAHHLWHALLAEAVGGAGLSILNGTNSALLYDTLLALGRSDDFRRREGRRQAMGLYGVSAAGFAAGFLYRYDHNLPLLMTVGAHAAALMMTLAMTDPPRHKLIGRKHPIKDIVSTAAYVLHGHATLGLLVLGSAFLFCATKVIMWSQQPYFAAMHLSEEWYGILMACGWLLGGVSSHWSHLFDKKWRAVSIMAGGWLTVMFVCLGAAFGPPLVGVALLIFGGSCVYGTVSPRVNDEINRHVGSDRRATALSTQSVLTSAFFIPASTAMGWGVNEWGIADGLTGAAVLLAVVGAALAFLQALRRRKAFRPESRSP